MKLNDHDQNFGNLDQKIDNFTDGQKKHLHTNVNRRLEAIELAEKQTFDLIQSLNSQIEVDRQEFLDVHCACAWVELEYFQHKLEIGC